MVLDLFFRIAPALQAIFKLGFEPKEELFYELTPKQYELLQGQGFDASKTWFTLIPKDPRLDGPEYKIAHSDEKYALLEAARYIDFMCENPDPPRVFEDYDDKLYYIASVVPGVFSESTKYGKKRPPKLYVVK